MATNNQLTTEIVFDDGSENTLSKNPFDLTKKQIWFKCFQRCFDEGSKQMSDFIDKNGVLISQPEVFMNSVTMFYLMSLGTLMEKKYSELFAKISDIDDRIKQREEKHRTETNNLINEHNRNPEKRIDVYQNSASLNKKLVSDKILLFREKLAVLSLLMAEERYLDITGGIND